MSELGLFIADLRLAFTSFQLSDFAPFILWSCWLLVLFTSLKGVDTRDDIVRLNYIAVIAAMGCALLVVLPTIWGEFKGSLESLLLAVLFVVSAQIRWIIAVPSGSAIQVRAVNSKNKGTP
jgi:hypothetical protein